MLRVRIELLPFGRPVVKSFWLAEIWNDGTGTKTTGNYNFRIFRKNSESIIWRTGHIDGYSRLKWSIWYLLHLILDEVFKE